MDLVEDFVTFGSQQVSLVFGEDSALSKLILGGFGPLVENIDSIFSALESLINFKRNMLETFLSENYDRDKLLREVLSKNIATDPGEQCEQLVSPSTLGLNLIGSSTLTHGFNLTRKLLELKRKYFSTGAEIEILIVFY